MTEVADHDAESALQQHWQEMYTTKDPAQVSWFQAQPTPSLELVRGLHLHENAQPAAQVLDVGGGASALASALLADGFCVSVLDIAPAALAHARAALDVAAVGEQVRWLVGDVLDEATVAAHISAGSVDIWHDRAVFHFLTDPASQRRYVQAAARAVRLGGYAIVATFAADGPEQCSNLPAVRYSADALAQAFAPAFAPVHSLRHEHVTPTGRVQPFTFVVLQRKLGGQQVRNQPRKKEGEV